jgi:hypothetical protein
MTEPESLHPLLRGRKNRGHAQAVFTRIVEYFYAIGYVTDADLQDPEQLHAKMSAFRAAGVEFNPSIDHRDQLTEAARRYTEQRREEMALMFYALIFEHTLNQIVLIGLADAGRSRAVADAVMRKVDLDGKLSWLLELLDLPALNDTHRKTIAQVAAERNAFVHYKWKERPWGEADKRERARLDNLLSAAKKAVRYIRGYESRLALRGNKAKIARLTRLEIPKVPP